MPILYDMNIQAEESLKTLLPPDYYNRHMLTMLSAQRVREFFVCVYRWQNDFPPCMRDIADATEVPYAYCSQIALRLELKKLVVRQKEHIYTLILVPSELQPIRTQLIELIESQPLRTTGRCHLNSGTIAPPPAHSTPVSSPLESGELEE